MISCKKPAEAIEALLMLGAVSLVSWKKLMFTSCCLRNAALHNLLRPPFPHQTEQSSHQLVCCCRAPGKTRQSTPFQLCRLLACFIIYNKVQENERVT